MRDILSLRRPRLLSELFGLSLINGEMTNVSIVPGIVLHDVIGSPVGAGDILLVPALFDFTLGGEGPAEHRLSGYRPDLPSLRALLNCYDLHDETVLQYWARARIPAAFGLRPPVGADRQRNDMLDFPFLAVMPSGSGAILRAVPFVCVEGYSGPGVAFRKSETDPATKGSVAAAFWGVLLRSPNDIAPFEEWTYDDEAGLQKVGCGRGVLFVSDLEAWEDESRLYDPHMSYLPGEFFCCPDCYGTGVEDLFPFTEDCATCEGTGVITW